MTDAAADIEDRGLLYVTDVGKDGKTKVLLFLNCPIDRQMRSVVLFQKRDIVIPDSGNMFSAFHSARPPNSPLTKSSLDEVGMV